MIDHTFESANRVYDTEGLAPTINTCGGGGLQPKIIAKTVPLGNLNGHKSGSGCYNYNGGGNREPMIVAMRGRNPDNPTDRTAGSLTEQRLEPNSQGICNTLTSVQKDNMVLERLVDLHNQKIRKNELCGTITANGNTSSTHCGTFGVIEKGIDYRIRKLTPLECWRFMGFSDEDFHKAEEVNSNSQLYKQAGNSIVKDVLMEIFRKILPEEMQGKT